MLTTRFVGLAVVAALLLPGCFLRRDATLPNVEPTTENPVFRMRATLGGDLKGTVEGDSEVSLVRTSGAASGSSVMAWVAMQPVGSTAAARFALTIDGFADNGTYRIAAGGPGDAANAQGGAGAASTVQMFWFGEAAAPDTSGLLFERRAEECTVEVDELGHKVTLRCPQLTTQDGAQRASVELEWHKV